MTATVSPPVLRACAFRLDVPAVVGVPEAVRRLAGRERVTAWSGAWSRGGLVTCDPVPPASGEQVDPAVPVVAAPASGDARVGGGWFGYLSFPGRAAPFPRHGLRWYPDVLRFDGATWWYEALLGPEPVGISEATAAGRRAGLVADLHRPASLERGRLVDLVPPDRTAHVVAVEEAVRAIRRGEIYQVNVATQVEGRFTGSPHDAWARLVETHAPARAGFVADPAGTAVGASPELFLRREGREVRTTPIKGTRPRTGSGDHGERDQDERARLAASAKDAAENVMIVDLMRNDLARVCATGTVTVPRLLAVEPHAGVWHLVSDVHGTLADGRDDADLLRATFPPGSVTGTPKIRAVELIEELEAVPRGLFTGALGYVSPLAGLELAVAIRTLEITPDGRARLGVGGGVTVDSTPVEEWAECLTKAAPLLETLGTGLRSTPVVRAADPGAGIFETVLLRAGHVRRLADHVGRLRRSYFEAYGVPLTADVEAAVAAAAGSGNARLRVVAVPGAPDRVDVTCVPFAPVPLAGQPGLVLRIRGEATGERHKLVDRGWLDAHEAAVATGETPLLVDGAGHVLESTRSSVFVVRDGIRTPPLDGRILPGTARQAVLDQCARARPAVVTVRELAAADGVFLTNALRGVQWVRELRDAGGAPVAAWSGPAPATAAVAAALDADDR